MTTLTATMCTAVCFSLLSFGMYGIKEQVDRNLTINYESSVMLHSLGALAADHRSIEDRITEAAIANNMEPQQALLIAKCESGLNPFASNPTSSAKGLYQFTDQTWAYINAKGHQFDIDENINQFMMWYPTHFEWWECE